jgi:hypothetical protein
MSRTFDTGGGWGPLELSEAEIDMIYRIYEPPGMPHPRKDLTPPEIVIIGSLIEKNLVRTGMEELKNDNYLLTHYGREIFDVIEREDNPTYEVVVGNVGCVYSGQSFSRAKAKYD